jgi:hypothetical protein
MLFFDRVSYSYQQAAQYYRGEVTMSTGVQMQRIGVRWGLAHLWHAARAAVIQLCALVAEDLFPIGTARMSDGMCETRRHQAAIADAQTLRRAIHANSSDEVDWLLYAAVLTDPAKRRYCLERALALNPDCAPAGQALACTI